MKAIAGILFALLSGSASMAQNAPNHAATKPVTVTLINASGKTVGTALLSPAPNGVRITLDIKSLPPGDHSIHIHQFAKCDPPNFTSAGAHFDGGGHAHEGHFAGDIPDFSLIVSPNGAAHVTTVAPNVTLGKDEHSVFNNGGTSIVIHAVADPSSTAAPPRIACGVIVRPD